MSFLYDNRLGKVVKSKLYNNGLLLNKLLNRDKVIKDLFAGGKQGVWYDPSDKSTLFQDVAGTIPVTKDGDPIGLMKDKSGNGYHATQSVSASRPLYKTDGVLHWFDTDGIDDWLKTNYTPSSDWSSHIAIKSKIAGSAFLFESYEGAANNYLSGGGTLLAVFNKPAVTQLTKTVLQPNVAAISSTTTTADNIGSRPVTIACRDTGLARTFFYTGSMYGLIIINGISSANDIAIVEQYLAKKSVVTL